MTHHLFDQTRNPTGLTDGGVVYGILIGKLGIPHPDQDFMGSRYVESKNIKIQKTRVKGLHAMPMEIPNIQTNDGTMVQGPARDLFRFSSNLVLQITTPECGPLQTSHLVD